jgi:hypothetical protein
MLDHMNTSEITIRPEYPDDELALSRLATLDSSQAPPQRPLLLAEVDGELRAALSLSDGSAVADPFHRTAALVELLRRRASTLEPTRASRRRNRVLPWLRGRHGVAAGPRLA